MDAPAPFTPRRRASAHGDSALDGMISALAPGTPASTIVYQGDNDEAITLNNSRLDLLANMVPIAELTGRTAFDAKYGSISRDVSASAAGTGLLTSAADLARAGGGSVAFASSLAPPPTRSRSTSRPRRQNLYAQRAPFTPEHVKLYYEHSVRAPVVPDEGDSTIEGRRTMRQSQHGATGLGPGQGGRGDTAALDVSAAAPRALHFTDDMRDGGENEDPRLGLGLAQRAVMHALRLPAVTGPVKVVHEENAQGQQAVVDARFLRTLKAKKVGMNAAPAPVPVHPAMQTGTMAGAPRREVVKAQDAAAAGEVIVSKSVTVRPVVPAPAPSLAHGRAQGPLDAPSNPPRALQHMQQAGGHTRNDNGGGRGPASHPAAVPAVRALTQAFEAAASETRRYGQEQPTLPVPAAAKDGRQTHSMVATATTSPATATKAGYVGIESPATAPSASSPSADSPGLLVVAGVPQYSDGKAGGEGEEEARARADMWRSARSPEGKVYYYHRHTRHTTWELPADVPVHLVKPTKYAGGGESSHGKAHGGHASTGKGSPARTPARTQEAPAATGTVPAAVSTAVSPTRAALFQLSPERGVSSTHAQAHGSEAVVMSPKEYLRSLIIQERAARRERSLSNTPGGAYGRAASSTRARRSSQSQSILAGLDNTRSSVVEQETGIEGLQPIAVVAGQSIQYMDMDSTTAEQRESVILNVSQAAGRVARDLRATMDGAQAQAHAHGMQEHSGSQGATKLSYKSYAPFLPSEPAHLEGQGDGLATAAFVVQEASVETSTATSAVPQRRSAYIPPEREEEAEAQAEGDVTSTTVSGPDPDYTLATILPGAGTRGVGAVQQGLEAAEDDPNARAPCQDCGRFFHPSRLAVHSKACKQVFGTRRSPYPTAVVRLKDTPASSLNFTSKTIPPCSHCGKKFPVESDAREHALTCRKGKHAGVGQGHGQGQGALGSTTTPGRVRSVNATGNLWSATHAAGGVEGGVNTTQSLAASASVLESLHHQQQQQQVVWPSAAWHEGAGDSLEEEAQDGSRVQPLPATAGSRTQRAAISSSVVRRSVGRVGSGTLGGGGRGRTLPVQVAWPAAAEDAAPTDSATASIILPTPAVARKLPFASPGGAATQGAVAKVDVDADEGRAEWEGESAEATPTTTAAAPTGALALLKTKMRAGSASAGARSTRGSSSTRHALEQGWPMGGDDHYSQTPAASSGTGSASSHASGSSAGGVFTPDPVALISPALSSAPMPAPAPTSGPGAAPVPPTATASETAAATDAESARVVKDLPIEPVQPAVEPVAPAAVPVAAPSVPVHVPSTGGVIDARVQRGVGKPVLPGAHRAAPASAPAPAGAPMEVAAVAVAAPSPQVRRSRAAVRASTPCTCAACGLVLPDPGQLVEHLGVCGGWARRLQTHVSAWSAQSRPGAVPGGDDDEGDAGEGEGEGGVAAEQAEAAPTSPQQEEQEGYSEEEQEPSAIEMEQSIWPSSAVPYKASSSPVGKAVARALFLSPSASPDTTTLSVGGGHGAYHRQNAVSVSPMDRAVQGGVGVAEEDSLLQAGRPRTAPGTASSPSMEDPASLPVGSPGRLAALAAAAEAAAANARAQAQHAAAAAALVAELQVSAGLGKGKGAAVAHARSGGVAGISRIPVPSSQGAQGHVGAEGASSGKVAVAMMASRHGAQASPLNHATAMAQNGRTPRM